jgi:hypothetical protein
VNLGVIFTDEHMDIKNIQKEINRIDWKSFSGPEHYEPDSVSGALSSLISLKKESLSDKVYNNVLFAIGNNHAGTYYPAGQKALKYIIQTAISGNTEIAKNCALNMLIDLYASFYPEMGNYNLATSEELEQKILNIFEASKEKFNDFINNELESSRNRQLAKELLDYIAEK